MAPFPTWRVYVLMGAVSAFVAAVVSLAVVSLAFVFFVGPRSVGPAGQPAGLAIEEDEADVPFKGDSRKGEVEVFYRKPFASPPKLTFPGGLSDQCFLVEQKADSFKLGRDVSGTGLYSSVAKVKWRAEGVPAR